MSNNTNNVVSSSSASLATSTPVRPTSGHHHPDTAGTPTNAGSGGSAMSGQYSGSHHDLTATASATSTSMQLNTTGSSGTPPTPGFVKHPSEKKSGRPAMKVLLPKLPSSDSLSGASMGPPSSPGLTNWADSSPRIEVASMEKLPDSTAHLHLTRKESYKAQRKNYRREKKRVASELLNSLQDPAIIVLADWLKVRGTLKSWTKLWCVLKPGLLLLYKSPKTKSSHWVGTILLTSCQIIERPSKKDGFCFKLFHPLDQTIWAPRGPDKESIGAVVQPLPTAYLIFRAPSQAAGKCWLDALELSLRCSALLLRSASGSGTHTELATGPECGAVDYGDFGGAIGDGVGGAGAVASLLVVGGGIGGVGGVVDVDGGLTMTNETQWSEADYEKHFHDHAESDTQLLVDDLSVDRTVLTEDHTLPTNPKSDHHQHHPNNTNPPPPSAAPLSADAPRFLANYIPPTPESLRRCRSPGATSSGQHRLQHQQQQHQSRLPVSSAAPSAASSRSSSHQRSSPATPLLPPSPSMQAQPPHALFQQLHAAVAHWERVLAGSPDLSIERGRMVRDLEGGGGLFDGASRHSFVATIPPFSGGRPLHQQLYQHRLSDPPPSRRGHLQPGAGGESELDDDLDDDVDDEDDDDEDDVDGVKAAAALLSRADKVRGAAVRRLRQHQLRMTLSNSSGELQDDHLDVDSQTDGANAVMSGLDSDTESDVGDAGADDAQPETPYVYVPEAEFGEAGEQVEELAEENKSLIWYVLKQVRPGMDLSKVVLPTFILEPRSFLDKLSDSYYHADYLSQAVLEDDPFTRMKLVVKWYLSGFYKKPKGLKKPYNPCLGEKFRCYWQHDNGSRTFYIAEQVSHHPPVSAFYVTNRQDGFTIGCSMLAKSKFYGNSTSAILDGTATLTLLPRGESYTLTIPYAHCKGILMGTLSMELGGKVTIDCENTGYTAELEFKLKPFLGGSEYTNMISGRLRLGKETLAHIKGHWDGEMTIKDTRSGEETVLFTPSAEVRRQRLRRFTVAPESLGADESERLWQHVSAAIAREDQVAATAEKTVLEDAQRTLVKERAATCTEWQPALFQQDLVTGQWHYKWADQRPWDPRTDVRQYEAAHEIRTKTRLLAPMVRTASIINTEPIILQADGAHLHRHRHRGKKAALGAVLGRRVGLRKMEPESDADGTDTSHSTTGGAADGTVVAKSKIVDSLKHINHRLDEQTATLTAVKGTLDRLQAATQAAARRQTSGGDGSDSRLSDQTKAVLCVLVGILLQSVISWLFGNRV